MTDTRRSYEGRPLPRPDEDVDDQGLAFDLTTMLDRRRALGLLGLGAAGLTLAACGSDDTTAASSTSSSTSATTGTSALTEIPDETAGPYPGDGSNGPDVLEQSGVVRSDIRSSFGSSTTTAEGVPMTLTLDVVDLAGGNVPFEGVAVYVWHCDRDGEYSLYGDGITDENYLRGVQIADEDGAVTFTSVYPACYSGRWPHVHFEVYPDQASITDVANCIATSQVALPEDVSRLVYATTGYEASVTNLSQVTLATDNVFGDDSGASQTPTATGDVTNGYALELTVGVDTTTTPTAGTMAGMGSDTSGHPAGGPGGGTPPTGAAGTA
ncbi:intradiol ring-cleavage dioxygenase [Kineococcus rhizosphaerae]|uniref:Dioxygenase-like protein n=1 Tax=Kineococcus rhizosphaerae TaxID=559628 RepID=A0A2T0R1S4_9ACTN|nr:intradiol ring-cleavage dioxygenase [Kineococcus rhizosphaerae]PRY13474.1 dioxygenase-like protein [Kineococcus rhizosphaerae]